MFVFFNSVLYVWITCNRCERCCMLYTGRWQHSPSRTTDPSTCPPYSMFAHSFVVSCILKCLSFCVVLNAFWCDCACLLACWLGQQVLCIQIWKVFSDAIGPLTTLQAKALSWPISKWISWHLARSASSPTTCNEQCNATSTCNNSEPSLQNFYLITCNFIVINIGKTQVANTIWSQAR